MKTFTAEQLTNGRKWVDALRSGKYPQGKSKLRSTDDKFCCLGVGCDVVGAKWLRQQGSGRCWVNEIDHDGLGLNSIFPPAEVALQLGLSLTPTKPDDAEAPLRFGGALSYLNDSQGLSFAEIADYIESEIYQGQLPTSEGLSNADQSTATAPTNLERVEGSHSEDSKP